MLKSRNRSAPTDHSRPGKLASNPSQEQRRTRDLRLGFLIHDVSRMRRRAFDEFMKPMGVTRAQWWIIAHISRRDGTMQSGLATILDVGKASLGTVIDRLEASGLVRRKTDPIDRRAKRVFMTKKAQNLIVKMRAVEDEYNEVVLRKLSEADRAELLRLLELVKFSLARLSRTHRN